MLLRENVNYLTSAQGPWNGTANCAVLLCFFFNVRSSALDN